MTMELLLFMFLGGVISGMFLHSVLARRREDMPAPNPSPVGGNVADTLGPDQLRSKARDRHLNGLLHRDDIAIYDALATAWEQERAVFTRVSKENELLRDARILDRAHSEQERDDLTEAAAGISLQLAAAQRRVEAAEPLIREVRKAAAFSNALGQNDELVALCDTWLAALKEKHDG